MSGPALLHLSFIAVVVVLLLVAWMAMVLHADEPPPPGQPEPAGSGKADATDNPSAAGRVTLWRGRRREGQPERVTMAGYRPGSDRGSPNHGNTLFSKRVMALTRSPVRVRTMRPVPWRVPVGARR